MLESFLDWIKQIVYLLLFLMLLMELLPQKSYGKYVRFFAGLVFATALVTPVASLVTGDGWQERLEQNLEKNLREFETAADTGSVNLDEMEEVRGRIYNNFAEQYTKE